MKAINKNILTRFLILASFCLLSACSSVGYIAQTTSGHLQLMGKRQPIEKIINDKRTSAEEKQLLEKVIDIRKFASAELGLPDNASYSSYVALDRDYVTWAVFASAEYSLMAKTWCFWIVGCVPYRGYFNEAAAERFARQLMQEGLEVYIAPIPAYSTLGWFSDPVLSTMLNQGELVAAEYIFHELAHQQLYIKNDADFNEAFATAVGQLGISAWLLAESNEKQLERYENKVSIKQKIYQQVDALREQLEVIYSSATPTAEKNNKKEQAYSNFKSEINLVLKNTNNSVAYQQWLFSNLNNAKLNALSTYQSLVPSFIQLFERCNRDFKLFYATVEQLKKTPKKERAGALMNTQCTQNKNI